MLRGGTKAHKTGRRRHGKTVRPLPEEMFTSCTRRGSQPSSDALRKEEGKEVEGEENKEEEEQQQEEENKTQGPEIEFRMLVEIHRVGVAATARTCVESAAERRQDRLERRGSGGPKTTLSGTASCPGETRVLDRSHRRAWAANGWSIAGEGPRLVGTM